MFARRGEKSRDGVDLGVQRNPGVERIGREAQPLQSLGGCRHVRSDLKHGEKIVAVDANGTVGAAAVAFAGAAVGIVRCALVVRGEDVFHILRCDFPLRHEAPGNIVGFRGEVGIRAVPNVRGRVEIPPDKPSPRRVVDVVRVVVAAEGLPGIQAVVKRQA